VSTYKRPWWLPVNKPAGLITSVREESTADERRFIIRGEPLVQGLAWLTWGPAAALLVVAALTGAAIMLDIRAQGGPLRILFIATFLVLPAATWGLAVLAANRLAARHLETERQTEAQECQIRLNQMAGEFLYNIGGQEEKLAFKDIRQVRVTRAIGSRDGKSLCLTLSTKDGVVVLLNERLGSEAQKVDLAREIQTALDTYKDK
jgi:hypothetical protein